MNQKICISILTIITATCLWMNGGYLWACDRSSIDELNLLSGSYNPEDLNGMITTQSEWHPFPRVFERTEWNKLPENLRWACIQKAEENINCDWETLKASVFMEYVRTGNRSHFQSHSFGRRQRLAELVLGECMEGKGRFLDDIMNGVWALSEETYWGVPAHVGIQKRGEGLPDITEPTVDLFAAETGMLLAWTYYLVGKELDEISPLITERIEHEIKRRILIPNLERDDFWWMGFDRTVNNWNPWICSNWLTAVLIIEKDPDLRTRSIYKILQCLDNFINPYPRDGGCDEGPGYWNRAGASLFDCLELLFSASKGRINIFDYPLIKEMGRYIYRVCIHYPYFINFADAAAKVSPNAGVVFRYGEKIKDEKLKGFGAFLAEKQGWRQDPLRGGFGVLGRVLPPVFGLEKLLEAEPIEPLERDFWLPELQVMGSRSFEGSHKSLYLACKGGHNAESHNHNDVGNFIVYSDGYPAVIDVGVEMYTAKTFSSRRYEIWTMQSAYHNLPTINGVMQKEGNEFKAFDVEHKSTDKEVSFSLDISKAYPDEAQVKSWDRTITLLRGREVIVSDIYELKEVKEDVVMHLMSWRKPEVIEKGKIRLVNPEQIRQLSAVCVLYDKDKFLPEIETIRIEDSHLQSSWGDTLYRIILRYQNTPRKGEYVIRIR
jgi:hypothetical protein